MKYIKKYEGFGTLSIAVKIGDYVLVEELYDNPEKKPTRKSTKSGIIKWSNKHSTYVEENMVKITRINFSSPWPYTGVTADGEQRVYSIIVRYLDPEELEDFKMKENIKKYNL
jgi:hypothetical protein